MHTFIREATFKNMADAMRGGPVAAQIAKYYKETTGVDVQLMRPISGSPLRLRFIGQIESSAVANSGASSASAIAVFRRVAERLQTPGGLALGKIAA